ncbi:MAG: YlmH/Sll1252 family protein [Syntrophomonas sp.]|nr:YlmH/Sll1252 family protein [Syntrophomonas sp.]
MINMNDYLIKLARNDDEKRLIARLDELVQKAVHGIYGHGDFLDLRQQELAQAVAVNELAIAWQLNGGYEEAERKRLVVYPEWEVEPNARLAYLRIRHKEFKEQSIGHRDYLGAVLNLGIKREKLGDIVVQNGAAFLIADIELADFICQQLTRVKHCNVEVEMIPDEAFVFEPPELTELQLSLASLRLDAIIAAAFNLSRSDVSALIEGGKVRINQMEIYKCSAPVKAGDLISVRGLGRFRLDEVGGITRKGRYRVLVSRG